MRRRLMCGVALLLAGASVALAQTATGVIRGRVQDTTGAVITDVLVKSVDERRNQSWDQTTNGEGFFEFREGHYGLRGMPERAALIGGQLAVWSEAGAGTEVELRLPAGAI